jgi:hypothetical protein
MQVKPELSQTRVVIQLLSKPIPWFINKHYPLISYVLTATNKQLLISESHGDSNRCTPCRGKPNTHDIYASHISPRTPSVRFLRTVPVRQVYASYGQSPYAKCTLPTGSPRMWQPFTLIQQSWTDELLPRKSAPISTSQLGWVVHGTYLSFSPNPAIKAMCLCQASVVNRYINLLGT